MIDMPPPIYLEYKNLSSSSAFAESQKDMIALVFKRLKGEDAIISELPTDGQNGSSLQDFHYWEVRCLSCPLGVQDDSVLVIPSLKSMGKNAGKNHEISFETLAPTGKTTAWRLQTTEIKPFLIHAGDDVKISIRSDNGIDIQSVGKSLKNGVQGEFIPVKINAWFNRTANSNSTKTIEAKVTAHDEVEYVNY